MTLKDKKQLDNVLQIVMPDDYYEDMRKLLLPHLIKWHESKVKNISSKPLLAAGISDDEIRHNLKDAELWIEQARLSYFKHKDKAHYKKSLKFASKFINACR